VAERIGEREAGDIMRRLRMDQPVTFVAGLHGRHPSAIRKLFKRRADKMECPWCKEKMDDYIGYPTGYNLAWDWYVCNNCFTELEADCHDEAH
jgi:hypothetical protein